MNNEVSLQVIHQGFEWRALLHKPLRYIIQFFSGYYCHTSLRIKRTGVVDGKIIVSDRTYDFTGKGGRDMLTDSWISEYRDYKKLKIYRYNIVPPLTNDQVDKIIEYCYINKDRKYNPVGAGLSILKISEIKWVDGGLFCSFRDFCALCYAGVSQPNYKDPLQDPNATVRELQKQGIIKNRIRIK